MENKDINKVTHCIFDMDGLLMDTESIYTSATQKVLDPYGKTYTWDVKSTLMGLHSKEVAEKIVEIYDLPITWEEYSQLAKSYMVDLMAEAKILPDTEIIYEEIIRDLANSYGKPYPFETRMRIMGTTERGTAEIAINELDLPLTVEQFLDKFSEMSKLRLADAKLLPGAERLLRHLHDNKIPICLATSSSEEMVIIKTKKYQDVFNLFHHKVCGGSDPEVKHGKPSPDIFLVAASRFSDNPNPETCLVFEDAPNGVSAARAAGMQVVMVPDPHVNLEMCKHATQVLKSLLDFKPEQFGLPPFPQ